MAVYTVHAPRHPDGVAADPLALVFVKDGFCWPALLIPVVWLVWRGLWLSLLAYLVLAAGLAFLSGLAGSDASSAVMVLFAVWFAIEANGLRRWTLERHGYALVGIVEGRNREEAERRFFSGDRIESAVPAEPPPAAAAPSSASPPLAPPPLPKHAPAIVGLFPTPGAGR